jgi:hypothetical protein
MPPTHEPAPGTGTPPQAPQADLDELLFTLEICRRALPWDAHPEHFERLRRIAGMVRERLERRERAATTGRHAHARPRMR